MRSADLIDTFEEKNIHIFRIGDVLRLTGHGAAYVRLMMSRLSRMGVVMRASRGVYYTKSATLFEVASNIVSPSYISLFSAFSYYGFLAQLPTVVDVITTRRHRPARFESASIRFITIATARFFGFNVDKDNIFVAEPEKAFIDALYLGSPQYGYVEEAFAKAMRAGAVNSQKLTRYAARLGSGAVIKKTRALLKIKS